MRSPSRRKIDSPTRDELDILAEAMREYREKVENMPRTKSGFFVAVRQLAEQIEREGGAYLINTRKVFYRLLKNTFTIQFN